MAAEQKSDKAVDAICPRYQGDNAMLSAWPGARLTFDRSGSLVRRFAAATTGGLPKGNPRFGASGYFD
ncbi:MAG: hypothetical protein WDM91_21890 [Rhizomicrobium sp.]